jgi:beta propeller repeat protein
MKSRLGSCAVGLGALLAVGASVRADVAGTSQQLGAIPGHTQTAPAVSGTAAVWTDFDGSSQFDIFFVDVSTGSAPVNLTGAVPGNDFLEDIDKTHVVFTHTGGPSNAPGDILMIDAATNAITNVASSDGTVHFEHPAIEGQYVVFERVTTQFDIDVYDLTLGGSPGPQVTNDPAMQLHPRVSGDVIVYEDYGRNGPGGLPDTYGYHVSTGGPNFLIAENARLPDVDGNSVVFVGSDAAGSDQIFLYDLSTGAAPRQLTRAASSKSTPRVSGTRVVYSDNRLGTDDVWMFDFAANTDNLLAGGPGSQTTGDISGTRVVYNSTDATGANGTVWMLTLAGDDSHDLLPPGCDPAKTKLVDGPVALSQTRRRPVYAHDKFAVTPGRKYYLCVDNGKPDRSQRSSHVLAAVDGNVVLTPSDFKPDQNPPRHVAAAIDFDHRRGDDHDDCAEDHHARHSRGLEVMRPLGDEHDCNVHHWDAALFAQPGTSIAVSIRVAQ